MSNSKLLRLLLAFFFVLPLQAACPQAPPPAPLSDSIGVFGADLFIQSGSTGMVLVAVHDNHGFSAGIPTQDSAAQAVYILPSTPMSQRGLDHAGKPTGIGLGWIHSLPADSSSNIVEKTGGGAGFQTCIAFNHSRRTAVFLAATDGSVNSHRNLFNATNKPLLAAAGLPPPPPPPSKPALKRAHRSRKVAGPAASNSKS
ncbi:MAG: hypothetical protein ABSB60_00095 [Terracidiphilus sp.]